MATIKLFIFKENNKTHTGFVVHGDDTLVFKNGSDEPLRITINRDDALVEHGAGVDLIKIDAGQQRSFSIGDGCGHESSFKYTATIGSSETEDPIIIIDRH